MAHRFRDPASPTPNDPAALGGHDHHHRFLRWLSGAQVRSASRPEGHLDRTTAAAGFYYRANISRRSQPNLCEIMWAERALMRPIHSRGPEDEGIHREFRPPVAAEETLWKGRYL